MKLNLEPEVKIWLDNLISTPNLLIDKTTHKHIVFFSGGIGSFGAAYRLIVEEKVPKEDVILLFTDTKMEDEDLYRFLMETSNFLNVPITYLADGRNPWQIFFDVKFLGNSRIDPCSKILKRDLARKWITTNFKPNECTLYLGIDWTEEHRWQRSKLYWNPYQVDAPLCRPPYTEKHILFRVLEENLIKKPRLYELGFAHNNCFSGDTRVVTNDGIFTLKDLVGQSKKVININGEWEDAEFKHFGKQATVNLILKRYGKTKIITTTANHNWFVRQGRRGIVVKTTQNLKLSDKLVFSPYTQEFPDPSQEGIEHGIMFVDGTRSGKDKSKGWVILCGDKKELECQSRTNKLGRRVGMLPREFKELPSLDSDLNYLAGFLAGYLATDGSRLNLSSGNRENLVFIRNVCARLGLISSEIKSRTRKGFGIISEIHGISISPCNFPSKYLLRSRYRQEFESLKRYSTGEWQVVSVVPTNKIEDVYCAYVAKTHSFALDGMITTGNCGGWCIKSGQAQFKKLLQHFPERFAAHEEKEKEIREFLNKDVSIMRKVTKGTKSNYTMEQLRKDVEAEYEIDENDFGGCGCMLEDNEETNRICE